MIASTPEPPYWAVIFTSLRTEEAAGYAAMNETMDALAAQQPGYLGMETAREGVGVTVSYWSDLDAVAAWREDVRHAVAQKAGRDRWYEAYAVRIARVERAYGWEKAGRGD